MPTTPIYGLPYQGLTDPPNGPTLGSALAGAVETQLARIDAAAATIAAQQPVIATGAAVNPVTNTTAAPGASLCGVAFVFPPSGKAYLTVSGFIEVTVGDGIQLGWEVRNGSTVGAGTVAIASSQAAALLIGKAGAESRVLGGTYRDLITGTPGGSYNALTLHWVVGSGSPSGVVWARKIIIEPVH